MSDEQINIAIAEVLGYEFQGSCPHSPNESVKPPKGPLIRFDKLPDYCNDINAMHEAEKVLTKEQEDSYVTILCLEVQPEPLLHHATARQRAEAFLKTIGKWEEYK
jgi:hypothetical protein